MGRQVGGQRLHPQARHMFSQVEGVGADIPQAAAQTRTCWIGSPLRLLVPCVVDRLAQPSLQIFSLDQADLAEIPSRHAQPRFLDQGVGAVSEGQRKAAAAGVCGARDCLRLLDADRHRLFAQRVKPRIQRSDGHGRVQMVGRHDRHRVDPLILGQGTLAREHGVDGRIDPARVKPE